jgi:hypothetical protein
MLLLTAEIDADGRRQRKQSNKLLESYGLDWSNPPVESFENAALQSSRIRICRDVNIVRLGRIVWLNIANTYVRVILASAGRSQAATTAWIELQKYFERTARREADLILASVSLFIPPEGPLSVTKALSLIWPLSSFGSSALVSPMQQARAQQLLFQIGTRAMIPIAEKLARGFFQPGAELSKEAHMIHQVYNL